MYNTRSNDYSTEINYILRNEMSGSKYVCLIRALFGVQKNYYFYTSSFNLCRTFLCLLIND